MKDNTTLTSRVLTGAGWVMTGKITGRLIQLVQVFVLARLLTPEDFGIFGITVLAIAVLETFSQTGFKTALVQHRGETKDYLDTAWTVQVIRGLIIAVVLYFAAPLAGWFFNEPRVVPLLRTMTISVVLLSMVNVALLYFQKDLEFHKSFIFDMVNNVSSLVFAVGLAYFLRSPWALIWAGILTAVVRLVTSYIMHPYRPRIRLNSEQASELFSYGRWVFASTIVIFLVHHGDDALVGRVLGPAALGIYQMAFRIANLAATEIASTANAVLFPAYSKLQNNTIRLRESFLKVLPMTTLLSAPAAMGTAAIAPLFVNIVLGERWVDTIIPLQILCFYGMIRAICSSIGSILLGSGRPKDLTKMAFVDLLVMAAMIFPATMHFGLVGTAAAAIAGLIAGQIYGTAKVANMLDIRPAQLLSCIRAPLISAITMGAAVYGLSLVLPPGLPALIILALSGVLIYLAVFYHLATSRLHNDTVARMNLNLLKDILSGLRRTPDAG